MTYDNNMRGTLGTNKRKEKDSHPDYSGSCEINGVEYWVSGWTRHNKQTGEKFMSLAFKEKDNFGDRAQKKVNGSRNTNPDDMDDNIPF